MGNSEGKVGREAGIGQTGEIADTSGCLEAYWMFYTKQTAINMIKSVKQTLLVPIFKLVTNVLKIHIGQEVFFQKK